MSWVASPPALSVPLAADEPLVALVHVPHTPLLVVISETAILVFHQHSLLPLASHRRTEDSLKAHGKNVSAEIKQLSLSTALLTKLPNANVFVRTTADYLVVYLLNIDYSLSVYEVTSKTSDEILQTTFPLSHTVSKFSLLYLIKSATRTLMRGSLESGLNLENIEHFANAPFEDEVSSDAVPLVKVSIFKMLKVNIGILHFWVKANSHNLIVYNAPEEFQVVNISTFKSELFKLSSYEWFQHDIAYINYDTLNNYVLFANTKKELWYLNFHLNEDSVLDLVAYKVLQLASKGDPEKEEEPSYSITFNPQLNLVLIRVDEALKLFKYDYVNTKYELDLISDITTVSKASYIEWSPLGAYFGVLNETTGKWALLSRFGNTLFDSATIFNEITAEITDSHSIDFLELSKVVIGPNFDAIYAVNKLQTKLYTIKLLKLGNYNTDANTKSLFYKNGYLSIPNNSIGTGGSTSFSRFPILPKFKSIISKIEYVNGSTVKKNIKNVNGYLKMAVNPFNQFSMSYGNHLAISTLFQSGSSPIHVLWFNFLNYYTETLNIIDHFWFDDFLVLINRFIKDDEILVDELIVLNTTQSKFGNGGGNSLGAENGETYFKFDSDLILWRHNFDSQFIKYEVIEGTNGDASVKNLIVVSDDLKIIIIELAKDKPKEEKGGKRYKIFIGINKTIHLSSIKHKLNISLIQQLTMINGKHFFFLLSNGDFYLLKNQTSPDEGTSLTPINIMKNKSSNMYDLIKINDSVEFFQLKHVHFTESEISFIYLFNGSSLLIYDLNDLVDGAFDNSSLASQNDGLDGEVHKVLENSRKNVIDPIKILINGFQPLGIENVPIEYKEGKRLTSLSQLLDLIGLEINTIYKNNMLLLKERLNRQVILNDFIEYDLFVKKLAFPGVVEKYRGFDNFYYCLELLLFKCLTKEETEGEDADGEWDKMSLGIIMSFIESIEDSESIYINCLRKIEIGYWHKFFDTLELTPVQFMNRLIKLQNVELCYNYLIIYLNFKKEFDDVFTPPPQSQHQNGNTGSLLDSNDRGIILEIISMLDKSQKWDRCFELCRFIKLLEPSNDLLRVIRESIAV